MDLDGIFKLSFAYDIVNVSHKQTVASPAPPAGSPTFILSSSPLSVFQGMEFIHKSNLKFHGNLKLSSCLVDSRLQVKLSGFGLWEFRRGSSTRRPLEEAAHSGERRQRQQESRW